MDIKRDMGAVTKEEAIAIYNRGQEEAVFFILEQSKRIKELEEEIILIRSKEAELPSTPSGMIPIYKKPCVKRERGKRPGQKDGHKGVRREPPQNVEHQLEHTLDVCPECKGNLSEPVQQRKRYIEDIPQISVEVTEHIINRYYCKRCKKIVEPRISEALPGATIGVRAVILSAYLHYAIGITIQHIVEVFNAHLHFPISKGGLVWMWQRLSEILRSMYEEIGEEIKQRGKLHSDETGWRVNGDTYWLWCFTDDKNTYYDIERCRGSPVILEFLGEDYDGILISDFYSAYNKVENAQRQVCLSHLFRELREVDRRNDSQQWKSFRRGLKRLLRDALRLNQRRGDIVGDTFNNRKELLHKRLQRIFTSKYNDRDCQRISKRLERHKEQIFTFLDYLDVPSDNNHAERELRPAVIMRKNSNCNRSLNGAEIQVILMSILRTLKRRNLSPLETLHQIMKDYLKDNVTPSLNSLHTAK